MPSACRSPLRCSPSCLNRPIYVAHSPTCSPRDYQPASPFTAASSLSQSEATTQMPEATRCSPVALCDQTNQFEKQRDELPERISVLSDEAC